MTWQANPKQISLITLALLPAARLVMAAVDGNFGANPVEFVQRTTGTWTFNFLLATLCITPLRTLTGAHWLTRLRRLLGLFCFFYASLHFLSFIGFDHSFEMEAIAKDVFKRPFVTVGFAAFLLLVPLAATSNQAAIRRLGGRRWQDLHRSVYLIGILAACHYFWLVKATALIYPFLYAVMLVILLGWRVRERIRKSGPHPVGSGIGLPPGTGIQPLRFFPKKPE